MFDFILVTEDCGGTFTGMTAPSWLLGHSLGMKELLGGFYTASDSMLFMSFSCLESEGTLKSSESFSCV